jgi:uncharacterized Zn finger protein
MDAAVSERPEWVIENARRRAEEIMDQGRSKAYHHAIDWLKQVKAGFLAAGRQKEWSEYLQKLWQTHSRKYGLVSQLKRL